MLITKEWIASLFANKDELLRLTHIVTKFRKYGKVRTVRIKKQSCYIDTLRLKDIYFLPKNRDKIFILSLTY